MQPLTALDELLVHQLPLALPQVATPHPHWRESLFFAAHRPDGLGDLLLLTLATYPHQRTMDSLQMGRVGGEPVLGHHARPHDGDPHAMDVGAARVEVVTPFEELRLWADPDRCDLGLDLTFRARTQPYGLRRGSMWARDGLVWDQSHLLQSGTYDGTYSFGGRTHRVDRWWGQRDHSWGVRDHGRCPLWLWLQVQLPDGFLGVWHWELANGTLVYSDGCWASTGGEEPVPVVGFRHDLQWTDAGGHPTPYGEDGAGVVGLKGSAVFALADGRRVAVDGQGTFDRPYEPFHRGGVNQMRVTTDDGREGTAICEVTGAHHHRYFPDTIVTGELPT